MSDNPATLGPVVTAAVAFMVPFFIGAFAALAAGNSNLRRLEVGTTSWAASPEWHATNKRRMGRSVTAQATWMSLGTLVGVMVAAVVLVLGLAIPLP